MGPGSHPGRRHSRGAAVCPPALHTPGQGKPPVPSRPLPSPAASARGHSGVGHLHPCLQPRASGSSRRQASPLQQPCPHPAGLVGRAHPGLRAPAHADPCLAPGMVRSPGQLTASAGSQGAAHPTFCAVQSPCGGGSGSPVALGTCFSQPLPTLAAPESLRSSPPLPPAAPPPLEAASDGGWLLALGQDPLRGMLPAQPWSSPSPSSHGRPSSHPGRPPHPHPCPIRGRAPLQVVLACSRACGGSPLPHTLAGASGPEQQLTRQACAECMGPCFRVRPEAQRPALEQEGPSPRPARPAPGHPRSTICVWPCAPRTTGL